MTRLKFLTSFIIIGTLALGSGCAWQKIPVAHDYSVSEKLPLKVGVRLSSKPASTVVGPRVLEKWKDMGLFEEIVYPYREDDDINLVLTLDIDGRWIGSGAGAGVVIGLTLGLASPFVGPSMEGVHTIDLDFNKDEKKINNLRSTVSTMVSWGLGADVNDVSRKTDDLLIKKLANAGARLITEHRDEIIALSQS